jgi:hypothetical protein
LAQLNRAGASVRSEESNQYGQTPTNWVSHPSGIGYRRSSPGITTWSGSGSGSTSSTGAAIPGNPVTMDTGMSDGGNQDEINRLNNFITGGNENPTAMQQGPIGRAEQTAMPMVPSGSPSPVGFGETTGRDVIGDVMNEQGGGTWTIYGNPLYHPSSASPNSHRNGSERSGASGRGYGNGGYGGPPVNPAPPAAASPPPPNAAPFVYSGMPPSQIVNLGRLGLNGLRALRVGVAGKNALEAGQVLRAEQAIQGTRTLSGGMPEAYAKSATQPKAPKPKANGFKRPPRIRLGAENNATRNKTLAIGMTPQAKKRCGSESLLVALNDRMTARLTATAVTAAIHPAIGKRARLMTGIPP